MPAAAGMWQVTLEERPIAELGAREDAASYRDEVQRMLAADPTAVYSGTMYEHPTHGAQVFLELPHGPPPGSAPAPPGRRRLEAR